MAITVNSPGWKVRPATRGSTAGDPAFAPLPPDLLAPDARIVDESIVERTPPSRGATPSDRLDVSYDIAPDRVAYVAVRHASGALTFHLPIRSDMRGGGSSTVRFEIVTRDRTTRGLASTAIKAILVEARKMVIDSAVRFTLPRLALVLEKALWDQAGRKEGWHAVSQDTLASGTLSAAAPTSPERSLLLLHGTFSHAAAGFRGLARSPFFERVADIYGGRLFAFNHFTISRTPEENARMLLQALPDQTTAFDVITHSRGGLVLRNIVERPDAFGPLARRFRLNRAVLVASPNEGTPLATPKRWEDTFGWFANLLDLFPDNPFTTCASFVAHGLVWMANHAAGDLPGLRAMDADGDLIAALQQPPGPDVSAYSALVSNYQPQGKQLLRLLDAGLDQFFGTANDLVVPTEGGWRVDGMAADVVPGKRIGCFGRGGNLRGDDVTHVNFFAQHASVDFLVKALTAAQQPLDAIDPKRPLPDRRLSLGRGLDLPAATGARRAPRPAADADADTETELPPLAVSVVHGDLTFEPDALLIGHYSATQLVGAERVIDNLIGGMMKQSLDLGHYPSEIGTQQIFLNTRVNLEHGSNIPRPKAVIVAGLEQEGTWSAASLLKTVRHAALAWSARLAEDPKTSTSFTLSSTLISSGGAGVSPGDAARLIAQGVSEANELLAADTRKKRWPYIERLKLIELYLDRAADAWRALRMQQEAYPERYTVDATVLTGVGGMLRPADSSYRGANYDFISVENNDGELIYTLDTRRARNPLRAKRTQTALLRRLIDKSSDSPRFDPAIGRTLFNLLVPIELEAYLSAKGALLLQLDPSVADIPWELLDTDPDAETRRAPLAQEKEPWAIRTKVIRKLRLEGVREQIVDANVDDNVLVIGEPECPKEKYTRLYGAHHEAVKVRDCLTAVLEPDRVSALVSADASAVGADAHEIVSKLYEHPWRIVHIAGHGEPLKRDAAGRIVSGGVVLSDDTYLGPNEIESMRIVPELVFVNCCHLAQSEADARLNPQYDRSTFAASLAQQLIRIGVRAVIAAGWAVDDAAANTFAAAFYASLLRGEPLIDAVGAARKAAFDANRDSNTWAAYQCYGDPDWTFRRNQRASTAAPDELDGFASVGSFTFALDRIIVETKFQGRSPQAQMERLRHLEALYDAKFGPSHPVPGYGALAGLFGEAYAEAGDMAQAITWYERATASDEGTASLKAVEQLSNAEARQAWETVDQANGALQKALRRRAQERSGSARRAAIRAAAQAERVRRRTIADAGKRLTSASTRLEKLLRLGSTVERQSLLGSVYKRQALIASVAGNHRAATAALRKMAAAYAAAMAIGRQRPGTDLYYALSNELVALVTLSEGRRGRKPDTVREKAVKAELKARGARADFWSMVGSIETEQLLAVARGTFAGRAAWFKSEYEALYVAVKAPRMWRSVYDTAVLVLGRHRNSLRGRARADVDGVIATLRAFAHPE